MTRTQALTELNKLDTATLEKLVAFSKLLIIPDNETLIKVTMPDMVDKAHALADIHFPEWTDRSDADFGQFLVELMALFSWKNFFYINGFTNEAFLERAKSYFSVALHALRLNYQPRFSRSMVLPTPQLVFLGIPDEGIVIQPGELEVQYPETDLVFTNLHVINVAGPGDVTVTDTNLYSGKYQQTSTRFNGVSLKISGLKNVFFSDPDDPQLPIKLRVDGEEWTRKDSFSDSIANSLHFIVMPSEGNELEIVFGKDGKGKRPPLNAICDLSYVINTGDVTSDLAAVPLVITRNVSGGYLDSVLLQEEAIGVPKPETLEELRQNAALVSRYGTDQTVKNGDDAINKLRAAGFPKAQAYNLGRFLFFTLIKPDGSAATIPDVTTAGNAYLDKLIDGFVRMPSLTVYRTINAIELKVFLYNEFSEAEKEEELKQYLEFITDPLQGANYGVGLDTGKVVQEILSTVKGVTNMEVLSIDGGAPDNIVLAPLEIFNKIDRANITINFVKIS